MSDNLNHISEAVQVFELLNPNKKLETSTMFVGGCVRDHILSHPITDIDLATIFHPEIVSEILTKNKFNVSKKFMNFGLISAELNDVEFEITTLREDVKPDGRYAKIVFTNDWPLDAQRRDFTVNAIYYDMSQSEEDKCFFDPYNGKSDLLDGKINFIKNCEESINEDFVRVLRYFRFFLKYSKHEYNSNILNSFFQNKEKIKKIKSNRMKNELRKIVLTKNYRKILENENVREFFYFIYPDCEKFLPLDYEKALNFLDN